RQAEHTKNENLGSTTWISNCTCRTALIYRSKISLMLYKVTLNSWGLAPRPPANTHTQKQGDPFSNLIEMLELSRGI
ncbi:hypothetical protein, partial [Paenibacillus dendritiformis]